MPKNGQRTSVASRGRRGRLPPGPESGSVAPMTRTRSLARLGSPMAVVPALLLASGCVTVTPAQRANLSKPEMTPATDADEESFHTHVEAAREGSMGGHGAAGGGCGCG